MARLARIDGRQDSPIESLTLPEALQRVVQGTMSGQALYDGAPKEICELLDTGSQAVKHTGFCSLGQNDQGELCKALLALMRGT